MKNITLFLIGMLITVGIFGQNRSTELKEVKVTPPKFTGIENVVKAESIENSIANYLATHFDVVEQNLIIHEGIEVVQFNVTTTGELDNIKIINSVSPQIDQEFIRILETTNGMWRPGYNNGTPVTMVKEVAMKIKGINGDGFTVEKDFMKTARWHFNKASKNLFIKENYKKALKSYDNAMRYKPYDQSICFMRGLCRYELGMIEGARQDWMRLKSLGGFDMDQHYMVEDVSHLKGYEELTSMFIEEEK